MIRIPRVIRVLHVAYKVQLLAHIAEQLEEGGEYKSLLGHVDHDSQLIRLATHVGPDRAGEVALHEVLHSVIAVAGLNGDAMTELESEEDFVNRISPILFDVIRENPKLLEYLTGRWVGGKGSAG